MSTISSILNTSVSGLMAYQVAIDVTSNNIANANTEGYSRQSVVIREDYVSNSSGGWIFSGCDAVAVARSCDQFSRNQVLDSSQDVGRYETASQYMSSIEAIFNELEGVGLSNALTEFWNSWQDLAETDSPPGTTERSVLVGNAQTLADIFNTMYSDLNDIQTEIDRDIALNIDEINDLINGIAELNAQLVRAEASGQNTNSLLDSLDSAMTELSYLVDINYFQDETGQFFVQLKDGRSLVDGSTSYELGTELNVTTGHLDITWIDGSGTATVITNVIEGGALGGALSTRDDLIQGYQNDLDDLALTLMTEINNLLTAGFDVEGQPGTALFTGTGAGDIAVDANIIDDPGLIAASATATGVPGDLDVAVAVAELQDALLMNGGMTTLDEFYDSLVSQVGAQADSLEDESEYHSDLLSFFQELKESVTGVSTNEETANLILYQNAYDACARVVTVVQEIMDTVLNM